MARSNASSSLGWVSSGVILSAAAVWACTQAIEPQPQSANDPLTDDIQTNDPATSGDAASSTTGDASVASDASTPSGDATEPNLKIAFIGDTGTGNDFKAVLQLIKRERAAAVLIQGDLNYATVFGAGADPWFTAIDAELQSGAASTRVPYFVAKGNHDSDWNDGYGPGLKSRMTQWGITPTSNDPTKKNYSFVFKGLKVVMVADTETSPVTRAEYVTSQLQDDSHLWKICSWHKNQRASNVGPKNDEMGWAIYENCRAHGAIVAQGHSHTYSRSKTLTNDATQTVDPSCSDPFALCVGPGKHFFFDSSVGGYDTRSLETSIANKPYWAAKYTGSYGALFIELNVDGDPNKARAYFKNTNNVVIDPPASSGKTSFTITRFFPPPP